MKRESAGRILKPSLRLHKNSYEDRKGNPRDRESNNKFEKKKKDIGFSFYVLLLLVFFYYYFFFLFRFLFIGAFVSYLVIRRCSVAVTHKLRSIRRKEMEFFIQ